MSSAEPALGNRGPAEKIVPSNSSSLRGTSLLRGTLVILLGGHPSRVVSLLFVEDQGVRERSSLTGLSANHLRHRSAVSRDGDRDRGDGIHRLAIHCKGHCLGVSIDRPYHDQSNRFHAERRFRVRLAVAFIDQIRTRSALSSDDVGGHEDRAIAAVLIRACKAFGGSTRLVRRLVSAQLPDADK